MRTLISITKKALVIALVAGLFFLICNQYLCSLLAESLSNAQFEYVQCSRHAEVIRIDYCDMPEVLKAKLLHLLINAARRSFLDINSHVLGVSVVKRGISANVHPKFIVFNIDRHNFTWQLKTWNTKEGQIIALELRQWVLSHSKVDSTHQE